MKRVLLLATGDTIAYSFGPGHPRIATGAELLAAASHDATTTQVVAEDVMAEPSWDMSIATRLRLARRVQTALSEEGFDGVVLTHGTDTVADSAFLTDLLAGRAADRGGIVFTCATRRLDEAASDGPPNLAASITAAADCALRGVGAVVCVNGELHAARWVNHVDATDTAAFSSAPFPVLGNVTQAGRVRMRASPPARPPDGSDEAETDIALITTYPDINPAVLNVHVDAGARGIVLEGTGAGNVPVCLLTGIHELTEWDIPVVIAARCHTGHGRLDDAPAGVGLAHRVGAIGARGLTPGKARYALMVALGRGGGVKAARDYFDRL